MNYICSRFRIIEAEMYAYISLHFILAGFTSDGFSYLVKAIKTYPNFIYKHIRFIAIIKHLFKNLILINKNKPEL